MAEIKITPELLEKVKQVKNVEELVALASENGVELTKDQAKSLMIKFNPSFGELRDEELDNVTGGGCNKGPETKPCRNCGAYYSEEIIDCIPFGDNDYEVTIRCKECGGTWKMDVIN